MIVDLALSVTGSQLIASVLPNVRAVIRGRAFAINIIIRRTKTSVPCSTTLSAVISSRFADARPGPRSSGCCTSSPSFTF